ncbi:MAG TPA: gluconate 2-dehydrogenase subunit 3 family protein [Mycobacteriales bacterium]|nr:gluconate 2-dehydrogenase subunit 3 family protein [Mycobacteriales bacterium]
MDDQLKPSRRQVVGAIGVAPLLTLGPTVLRDSHSHHKAAAPEAKHAAKKFRFFTEHEGAVIKAAAARLVPGPEDDPIEKLYNSPGATEAGVVYYIDDMLSAFEFKVPKIFAGGPWSNRHLGGYGDHENYMKHFVPLAPRQEWAWRRRIAGLRKQYRSAVKQLDAAAGGDFSKASQSTQDQILTKLGDVRGLIFTNTIEGMYSVPEYGGNRDTVGWQSVLWPGDSQRRGYTAKEVETSDGLDVVVLTPTLNAVLGELGVVSAARRLRRQRSLGVNRRTVNDAGFDKTEHTDA